MRNKNDYYATPQWAIDFAFSDLLKLSETEPILNILKNKNIAILDPCAGGDEENPMAYPYYLKSKNYINIETLDIREDSLAQIKTDFLNWNDERKFDLIITNPPYLLAQEFIEKSLNFLNEDGVLILLLRLNFFGSQKRKEWLINHLPTYCLVHSKRIPFTSKGTDSTEYAHFVWHKSIKPKFCKTKIIETE